MLTFGFAREKSWKPRAIEHAGHARDHALRATGDALVLVDHRVERVRDDDDERVRAVLFALFATSG